MYWLPVIGPTSYVILRHMGLAQKAGIEAFQMPLTEFAQRIGLGKGTAHTSPIGRTLKRLETFDMVTINSEFDLTFATMIPDRPEHTGTRKVPATKDPIRAAAID